LNESEKPDLKNVFTDAKKLVKFIKHSKDTVPEELAPQMVARMRDELEQGLSKLDGQPPAVVFFGGGGERSKAAAPVVEKIAHDLAETGATLRVTGSPYIDQAVLKGARSVNPTAEIQAFAMADAPVQSEPGLDYTKVRDVLVLRELADTNIKAIVTTPEGAKQLAMMFAAACDMQTKEIPKKPIIVMDPDGKFAELKKTLAEIMLSDKRKYINPEDLDLFTVTNDPQVAKKALEAPEAT
jgi:predicted Rossmann-fold nucleotide-binding protein